MAIRQEAVCDVVVLKLETHWLARGRPETSPVGEVLRQDSSPPVIYPDEEGFLLHV